MKFSMLIGPVIGACIGYFTNYIAVKMLFWPRKKVMIGKFHVPFTPGVIPKGQPRLARAIGSAVGDTLLTGDDIKENLLSDSIRKSIGDSVVERVYGASSNGNDLGGLVKLAVSDEKYGAGKARLEERITDEIINTISNMNVGRTIAEQGTSMVKARVSGSFIRMMVNDSMIASFAEPIESGVNDYIANNGKTILMPIVGDKLSDIEAIKTGDALNALSIEEEAVRSFVDRVYLSFVDRGVTALGKKFNIAKIVEDKVNAMDVKEIEDLTLAVMKKELDTVVNLGAVIGFILGLLNVLV